MLKPQTVAGRRALRRAALAFLVAVILGAALVVWGVNLVTFDGLPYGG